MWYVTYYGIGYPSGLGVLVTFDAVIVEKFLDDRLVTGFDSTQRTDPQHLRVRVYPDDWATYVVTWESER